jgi:hypothetical protein
MTATEEDCGQEIYAISPPQTLITNLFSLYYEDLNSSIGLIDIQHQ